jgi:hypothetical protein
MALPTGQSVTVGGSASIATIAGLTSGATYTFRVVATNSVGAGPSATSDPVTLGAGVPTAPSNVVASPGNASATVSWSAPSSNGGSPITGYTVVSNVGGFSKTVDGSTLSTSITGLTNGTAYRFQVFATNLVGDGPKSSLSTAVTPRTVPDPPTGVSAVPKNASATVSWTAPAFNGGSAITGYTVTASPGGASVSVGSSARSATVTGLTNGTSYTFTVRASNIAGLGAPSAPSSAVTPRNVPSAPTNVVATAGIGSASVTWVAPTSNGGSPITSYTVISNTGGFSKTVDASMLSTTITGLTPGVSYKFQVYATNVAGNGTRSTLSNAVVPTGPPGAPGGVAAAAGNGSATITWTAAAPNGSAVASYVVTAFPGGQTTTVSGSSLAGVVIGLTNGTNYTFKVVATNAIGPGPASSASNVVVPSNLQAPIVFGSNRTGSNGYDIYWMLPDGTGQAPLLKRAGADLDPALSPDGSRVVFTGGSSTTSEIWVMGVDGSGLVQLTANSRVDQSPNWSPDGTQIVFASNMDGGSDLEIYVMNADGTGTPQRLTNNTNVDYLPDWSPDGARIAFSSNRISNAEIWVMDADGTDPVRLTQNAGTDYLPAWSPDGTRIAFSSNQTGNWDVIMMNADGTGQTNLTNASSQDVAAAWSPDGTQLVFQSSRDQSPNYELYRMLPDGTSVVRLTTTSGNETGPDW